MTFKAFELIFGDLPPFLSISSASGCLPSGPHCGTAGHKGVYMDTEVQAVAGSMSARRRFLMTMRHLRRRRIWALLLVACGAEEALPTAPPLPTLAALPLSTLAVTPAPAPANQTAAEVAVGEIAAQAAAAAGASLEDVVQSAANGAGLDAAKTARAEGQTEAQVEKAAASAAEAAAQTAGATKEQAAKAAGEATVEVSKSKDTVAAAAITDAWSLVPGTECLNWWGILARHIMAMADARRWMRIHHR